MFFPHIFHSKKTKREHQNDDTNDTVQIISPATSYTHKKGLVQIATVDCPRREPTRGLDGKPLTFGSLQLSVLGTVLKFPLESLEEKQFNVLHTNARRLLISAFA